jgi:hypothetical protein
VVHPAPVLPGPGAYTPGLAAGGGRGPTIPSAPPRDATTAPDPREAVRRLGDALRRVQDDVAGLKNGFDGLRDGAAATAASVASALIRLGAVERDTRRNAADIRVRAAAPFPLPRRAEGAADPRVLDALRARLDALEHRLAAAPPSKRRRTTTTENGMFLPSPEVASRLWSIDNGEYASP